MEKELEPTFVRRIQKAMNQGQVVLIPAPAPAAPPSNTGTASLAITLCLLFKLDRRESRTLVELLVNDFGAKENIRTALVALVGRTVTDNNLHTIVASLRKKLEPFGIQILTVPRQGYVLDKDGRAKIRTALAKYNAGPRKTKAPVQADLFES
jgi:hypothetical protein